MKYNWTGEQSSREFDQNNFYRFPQLALIGWQWCRQCFEYVTHELQLSERFSEQNPHTSRMNSFRIWHNAQFVVDWLVNCVFFQCGAQFAQNLLELVVRFLIDASMFAIKLRQVLVLIVLQVLQNCIKANHESLHTIVTVSNKLGNLETIEQIELNVPSSMKLKKKLTINGTSEFGSVAAIRNWSSSTDEVFFLNSVGTVLPSRYNQFSCLFIQRLCNSMTSYDRVKFAWNIRR